MLVELSRRSEVKLESKVLCLDVETQDVVSGPPAVLCLSTLNSTAAAAISKIGEEGLSGSSVYSEVGLILDQRFVQDLRIAADAPTAPLPIMASSILRVLTPGRAKPC